MGSKAKYRKYNLLKLNEETHKDDVFYKELPIDNKDFDERLIVTYSIKYRDYARAIREKQVIRAKRRWKTERFALKRMPMTSGVLSRQYIVPKMEKWQKRIHRALMMRPSGVKRVSTDFMP